MINPEALIRPKMFPAKRYQRNLLKVKVYEHNEEQKPSGQRVRTHSSILKSFEMESRLKGKKVRIQDQKDEKSDDEFSLLKKFNKPISPIPTKIENAHTEPKSEPNKKYLNEQMEKLERIKNLGRSKINYKKQQKSRAAKLPKETPKLVEEPIKPFKPKPMKPSADQDQLASVLAMELSSLLFFFDHFPVIAPIQITQMRAKVDHVTAESQRGQLFTVFINLKQSLAHLHRDLPSIVAENEWPVRRDQVEDCVEQLFKLVE